MGDWPTSGPDPVGAQDLVTLNYLRQRDVKFSARVATTAALPANTRNGNVLTASANGVLPNQDGVTLITNDRILVKDEDTPANNGIYTVTSVGSAGTPWVLTRAIDADTSAKMTDATLVMIEEGSQNADTAWELTSNNPVTLNTTSLYFTRVFPGYGNGEPRFPWSPTNSLGETCPRPGANNANNRTSGVVYCAGGIMLRAGRTYSAVTFVSVAASVTPTNSWAGIARQSDRVILAISPTNNAVWAAATARTYTFTSPYTPKKDEPVYVFLMQQAGTPATIGGAGIATSAMSNVAPILSGSSSTGQTAPPAVGAALAALTAAGSIDWAYLT